jgi:DNA replication protein DnaC
MPPIDTTLLTLCRVCRQPVPPRAMLGGRSVQAQHCSDRCLFHEYPHLQPPRDRAVQLPLLTPEQRRAMKWDDQLSARQRRYEFKLLKPLAQQAMQTYSSYQGEHSLLFIGASEAGKTYVAYRLARQAHLAGRHVIHRTAAEIRARWLKHERSIDAVKEAEILLIDDLGMENPTPGWTSDLYEVLRDREDEGLTTLITLNRIKSYYAEHYSTPFANRLWRMEMVNL